MADLVFRGGQVLSLSARIQKASAAAVEGDRIVAVGSDREISSLAASNTKIIDLAGRTLMPGLTDGHAHLDREGLKSLLPSVSGCRSIRELVERLREIAAKTPVRTWIVTMPLGEPPEYAWSEAMFAEGRLPSRHDLDQASTEHPIFIRCAWGYWPMKLPLVSIANSAALALAGITRDRKAPSQRVKIEADESGEPSGRFFDNAFQPITEFTLFRQAPHFSADDRARTIALSMRMYNAVGTTAVFEGHGVAAEVIDAYRNLNARKGQTVRARLTFSPGWSGASEADVMDWVKKNALKDDPWLELGGLYAEVDAAPNEARLRAQCAPRTGWAGFNYDCGLPREKLILFLKSAARERLRVCAIQTPMLELFAEAAKEAPLEGLRWVIAHPITLDARQIALIRDLGVVITTHTNAYLYRKASETLSRIGRERENQICPIRSLLDAGITVSLATDNVPISLWNCVWQAVERVDRETGEVIAPSQRISREEALRCATTHGARLCFDEDERGTLEPGKLADMIVLPDNPLTMEAGKLKDLVPDLTIAGGRVVWQQGDPL